MQELLSELRKPTVVSSCPPTFYRNVFANYETPLRETSFECCVIGTRNVRETHGQQPDNSYR
ncbi:hypothetical protein ABH999_002026 [Bradyrhizobium yuanmingense]